MAVALALAEAEEENHVPARLWVHDITRGSQQQGAYHNLVQELRFDDARFAAYFRLNKCQFEQLLRIVAPSIAKLDTKTSDRPLVQKNGSAFVYGELYLLTSLFDLAYHAMIIVKSVSFYKLPKTLQ